MIGVMMSAMADGELPAGLVDPDAPDADAQRALAEYLLDRGIPVADLRAARAAGSMAHFVADAALWPDRSRVTVAELAERAGLDVELARRARRMIGVADPGDDAMCHAAEVEFFSAFAAGVALFGEELTVQFARVIGTSAAAIAEAATNLFAGEVAAELAARGATDAELGITARDAMVAFEAVTAATDIALRLQFEQAQTRLNGEITVDELIYAVAFVDVVDSTAMAGELAGREDHLVLKAAKAGLTFGAVAAHDGDYFGQVVNLAARASTAAIAGEILLSADAARALPGRTEPAGDYDLKGFAEPVPLYRLKTGEEQP